MTTRVESDVRAQFALEYPGEAFDPARVLRYSIAPWEHRTPEEIALYDAYHRYFLWFAFDKGVSMAGTVPNVPALQAAIGVLGVPWEAIIGPRSPPRTSSSGFLSVLESFSDGFWDVAEVIRPILINWAAGQIIGSVADVITPADAPEVLKVLGTDIAAAGVEETTGVSPMAGTAEGTSNIWGDVIGAVGQLGSTAIATFGGDGSVQPTFVGGVQPAAPSQLGAFLKTPLGLGAIAAAVVGAVFLFRK